MPGVVRPPLLKPPESWEVTAEALPSDGLEDALSCAATEERLGVTAALIAEAHESPSLAASTWRPSAPELNEVRRRVLADGDPLGESFAIVRGRAERRKLGATYTPWPIVGAMTAWARRHGSPDRVVDVGAGSGRFLLAAGNAFPKADLVGVEVDPLAAMVSRANLALAGFSERGDIVVEDYRGVELPETEGPTLFIGNPPYVRHHLIDSRWKEWLSREAAARGFRASQLAGLHVHFFLSTLMKARPGDYGVFVTAAEWLDVNYGRLVRDLLVRSLHAQTVTIVDPAAQPFPDAATTGVITTFKVGNPSEHVRFRKVGMIADLGSLDAGQPVPREQLATERRWSTLTAKRRSAPAGFVELGELCRVHRGSVTGSNRVWIAGAHSQGLPPRFLNPTVTRAREIIDSAGILADAARLRSVIDLPEDLDCLEEDERKAVEWFLQVARSLGAHEGYVARNRKCWWAVKLRPPAPIVATYMARRPPAFALNPVGARLLNIAHGIYPREPLSPLALKTLRDYLSKEVRPSEGRTYAGGLVKFEPREMERICVPPPESVGRWSRCGWLAPRARPAGPPRN